MATIDGYHWKLKFYRKGELIDEIEGWPSEDKWRYGRLKEILEFAERYIPKDLGSELRFASNWNVFVLCL